MGLEVMKTLHILTQQDSKFVGGVGQEFRKHIRANCCGGSWSKYIKANWRVLVQSIRKYTEQLLFCILDKLPPLYS